MNPAALRLPDSPSLPNPPNPTGGGALGAKNKNFAGISGAGIHPAGAIENSEIFQVDLLDYAGGVGSLARILEHYYRIKIKVYEEYMSGFKPDGKVVYVQKTELSRYQNVLNSAMFEHITKREHLEHINALVAHNGALIIHTLVRENIPKNPLWFYALPVHCSFHTNASMEILMRDFGFSQSLYSPISKCWVLFKGANPHCQNDTLESYAKGVNARFQQHYFYHKRGFVDYWRD